MQLGRIGFLPLPATQGTFATFRLSDKPLRYPHHPAYEHPLMINIPPEQNAAAEQAAGCEVVLVDFVHVIESRRCEVIWEDFVSVFSSDKGAVYAWTVEEEPENRHIAVVGTASIDSPLAAVRAWLASEAR